MVVEVPRATQHGQNDGERVLWIVERNVQDWAGVD